MKLNKTLKVVLLGAPLVVFICLIAIPRYGAPAAVSEQRAIRNNLRYIVLVGHRYMIEKGVESVGFTQLRRFDPAMEEITKPRQGETYEQITIESSDTSVSTKTIDGVIISIDFGSLDDYKSKNE